MFDFIGYGCIVCDDQGVVQVIVEYKDVILVQCQIGEINIGIFVVLGKCFVDWFGCLFNDNVQGEYYLIDVIVMVVGDGLVVVSV